MPKKRKGVTDEDYSKTLPHIKGNKNDLSQLLYETGARPTELFEITWGAINTQDDDVWEYHTHHKTEYLDLDRVILLNKACQEILLKYKDTKPDDLIFTNRDGNPYNRRSFRKAICRACKKAGVKWFPYMLRHNAGKRFKRQYGKEVARILLGHTSVLMTENYIEKDIALVMQLFKDKNI